MTVSAQTPFNRSTGNGVTTVFPYTFKIAAQADLEVSVDGVVQTLTTHYTVSGVGDAAGGNVTFVTAPASGTTVVRRRNMAYTRSVDYQNQGDLRADVLNPDQDAPVLMAQQLADGLTRALRLPVTSTVDAQLASPDPSSVIGWSADGSAVQYYPLADLATSIAFATYRVDPFTGDGVETDFNLTTDPVSAANLQVFADGFLLDYPDDYTFSGTTLTFTQAPVDGEQIRARYGQGHVAGVSADANDVNYQPAGAGAVARTAQAKLRDVVSGGDFGVAGDGTTDDTAAIELVSTRVGTGGIVFLKPGMNCRVTSEVDLSTAGLMVTAYGAKFTKDATFTGSTVIRVAAEDVTIKGLEIDGTDKADDGIITSASVAAGFKAIDCIVYNCLYGISANSNSRITLEGNDVSLVASGGIRCHNIADTATLSSIKVRGNRIDLSDLNPATTTQAALLVRGTATKLTTDVDVSGNYIVHAADPTNSAALCAELRFCDGPRFENNHGKNGSMLVSIAASPNGNVTGNTADGPTFYAIEIAALAGGTCDNTTIGPNTIHGRGRLNYAIGLQGSAASKGCAIAPQAITGVLQFGIYITSQWDDVSIAGGSVTFSDAGASQYGVYALGPIDGLSVSGMLLNGGGVAEKAIYLLDVTNASITGNTTKGWLQNDVLIHSLTSTDLISISGNTFASGLGANAIGTTGAGTFGEYIQASNNPGYRLSNTQTTDILNLNRGVYECSGTGTPEAAVTASVGSVFHRRDGGAGTCLYIKESGTATNTGWIAK